MKVKDIKDIKANPGFISNEDAMRFLYFVTIWDGYYCDFVGVTYHIGDGIHDKRTEIFECDGWCYDATEFIDDLELEQLDKIICEFRTGEITRFEFCFNYDRLESPGYAIINVTSREK